MSKNESAKRRLHELISKENTESAKCILKTEFAAKGDKFGVLESLIGKGNLKQQEGSILFRRAIVELFCWEEVKDQMSLLLLLVKNGFIDELNEIAKRYVVEDILRELEDMASIMRAISNMKFDINLVRFASLFILERASTLIDSSKSIEDSQYLEDFKNRLKANKHIFGEPLKSFILFMNTGELPEIADIKRAMTLVAKVSSVNNVRGRLSGSLSSGDAETLKRKMEAVFHYTEIEGNKTAPHKRLVADLYSGARIKDDDGELTSESMIALIEHYMTLRGVSLNESIDEIEEIFDDRLEKGLSPNSFNERLMVYNQAKNFLLINNIVNNEGRIVERRRKSRNLI